MGMYMSSDDILLGCDRQTDIRQYWPVIAVGSGNKSPYL